MPTVHPETSLVFQRIANLDAAETRLRNQASALRTELRWQVTQMNNLMDDIAVADGVETDPVVANRLSQLANSLGAFRHLAQTLEDAGAKVLAHYRQLKQDRQNLRDNAPQYNP